MRGYVLEAQAILTEEGPKQEAREQLEAAAEACTIELLKAAIEKAKAVGLLPEEYQYCEDLAAKEAGKVQLLAKVNEVMEKSKAVDTTSIEALGEAKVELNNAILEAKDGGCQKACLGRPSCAGGSFTMASRI